MASNTATATGCQSIDIPNGWTLVRYGIKFSDLLSVLNGIPSGKNVVIFLPNLMPFSNPQNISQQQRTFGVIAGHLSDEIGGQLHSLQTGPFNSFVTNENNTLYVHYVSGSGNPGLTPNQTIVNIFETYKPTYSAYAGPAPTVHQMLITGGTENCIAVFILTDEAAEGSNNCNTLCQIQRFFRNIFGPSIFGVPITIWLLAGIIIIPPVANAITEGFRHIPGGER